MSTLHLDIYAQVITLNHLYYSQLAVTAFQYRELDQVWACREGSHMCIWWRSNRMQEALLHKYHFNFLLLLNFSQWERGG